MLLFSWIAGRIRNPLSQAQSGLGRAKERCLSPAANIICMIGRPEATEAASYYFGYINRVAGDDIVHALQNQLDETLPLLHRVSEEKSLHRYAPDKWTIREMWNHVNDAERVFLFRALWFARGHDSPLPSFEQDIAAVACQASDVSWASHVAEFHQIRLATLSFFR